MSRDSDPAGGAAIRVAGLTLTRPGAEAPLLRDVSFDIEQKSLVALLAPSGSGKTTLLRILAGFERPDAGTVRYGGEDFLALPDGERRRIRRERMGFLFQEASLLPELSPLENAALRGLVRGEAPAARLAAARGRFAALGMAHLIDRRTTDLSGGEAMRVALLRALHGDPDLLFADEPTASLDLANGRRILAHLSEYAHGRAACLVATHDERLLPAFDRVLALRDGGVEEMR